MKKRNVILTFLLLIGMYAVNAQTVITGTVSDADGIAVPGANVRAKGYSDVGTITDASGSYSLSVPNEATKLVFSFVGLQTKEVAIAGQSVINVSLSSEEHGLDEVVVTALGITREKNALGYAVQEVNGDDLNNVKSDNFVNAISGKVSGVQVKRTTNMGGSTNIVIRGSTSLTGDNQALFVIDGVPVSNMNTNSRSQEQAGQSYDWGNAASDINPDDIESISVLKGAAATALYGSRAANGVIMITTKKGDKSKGVGITFNSGITISSIDKSTFPKYQSQYGAGYGPYYDDPEGFFWYEDISGDGNPDLVTPMTEDASYGAKFDGRMVYQWDAFDLESPNYMTATPWKNAENGPITFFETPITYTNSIAIENAFDKGSFRIGYTNLKQNGLMPNSEQIKHNFNMNLTYNLTDKLTVGGMGNYIKTNTTGRNSTGYNDNIIGSMRQWWQTNVDLQQLKDAYFSTGRNVTWNYSATDDSSPIYWDNPYWTRHENYASDDAAVLLGIFP